MNKASHILKFTLIWMLFFIINVSNMSTSALAIEKKPSQEKILISTVKDFEDFTNNCSLDTYSLNKIFILENDIDFNGDELSPVPIFSGTFQGNGHILKGFTINSGGSDLGLFRYIEKLGVVNNLIVWGNIHPSGTQMNIGGIVGKNKGRINNCTFNGSVFGKNNTGGIAGVNSAGGYISNCVSKGTISGEHSTGGIAGQNHGIIMKCSNSSSINTQSTESTPNLNDINMSTFTKRENTIRHTDTGGIVGFTDGVISHCTNLGDVGYPHVGYNISGIAGRQSGYISNCENKGNILGRKDVGGIVGQMEPFLQIKFSEDTLKKLDSQLISLRDLINSTLNHVDSSSLETTERMNNILSHTDNASEELNTLMDATSSFADETIENVNELFYRVSLIVEESSPVLGDLEESTKLIGNSFEEISYAFSNFKVTSVYFELASKEFKVAFKTLSAASLTAAQGIGSINDSIDLLEKNLGDEKKMKEARESLNKGLDDLENSINTISDSMKTLADLFGGIEDIPSIDWQQISNDLIESADALSSSMESSIANIREGASTLSDIISDDIKTIKSSFKKLRRGLEAFQSSAYMISASMIKLETGMGFLESGFNSASYGFEGLSKGADSLKSSSDKLTSAVLRMKAVIDDINTKPPIVFPKLGDKISDSSDNFFNSLDSLSAELSLLNDDSSSSRKIFIKNLKDINQKIYDVFKVIIDARKRTLDGLDLYNDISQDDIQKVLSEKDEFLKGYVHASANYGSISGDINIGGIAGSMAIEYDFDPESEIVPQNKKTLKFQYQTRTILNDCSNFGSVLSKKDYAGGIAGRMDLGLLLFCKNFGPIESSDGDYVGGICGYSSTIIRGSYSLCTLEGGKFVGGIAGSATDLYDSASLVDINRADENYGAISGEALGEFKNNSFVSSYLHGIDSISYSDKAYPLPYKDFIKNDGIPVEFTKFNLTFKALGNVIKKVPFHYGDSLSTAIVPALPELDGYFSGWPDFDYSELTFSHVIEAIYNPYISSISSSNKTDTGLPLLLAEGNFDPASTIFLMENKSSPKITEDEILIAGHSVSICCPDDDLAETHVMRFYSPDAPKNLRMMIFADNKWTSINFHQDGSYIVFTSIYKNFSFCLIDSPFNIKSLLFPSLVLMFLLFLLLITLKFIKGKHQPKKINS